MATIEDVIATKDPEAIKKRRSTVQRWTTGVRNNLDRLLVKTAGKFDHSKIERLEVHDDQASLKKHYEDFKVIHGAFMEYRAEGNCQCGQCLVGDKPMSLKKKKLWCCKTRNITRK